MNSSKFIIVQYAVFILFITDRLKAAGCHHWENTGFGVRVLCLHSLAVCSGEIR